MIQHDAKQTVGLVRQILEHLRNSRAAAADDPPGAVAPLAAAFCTAAAGFAAFLKTAAADEAETAAMAERFSEIAEAVAAAAPAEKPAGLVRLLLVRPHDDLCTAEGKFLSYRKKTAWVEAAKRAGLSKAEAERLNNAADGITMPVAKRVRRCRRPSPPTCWRGWSVSYSLRWTAFATIKDRLRFSTSTT
jgi:exodeoxyribonuclease-5